MNYKKFIPASLREAQTMDALGAGTLCLQALLTGLVSGAVIGLFRWLYDTLRQSTVAWLHLAAGHTALSWLAVAAGLCLLAALAYLLLRHEPLISGSGIPQVELMASGQLPPMRWHRVLWTKFVATLAALTAGLSVGREGPCIQMGACVGAGVGSLWHAPDDLRSRFLIGGSVAGLTAAFGAPLAGMLFAFEEMRSRLAAPLLLFTALSALGAWAALQLFGFGLVFPFARWSNLDVRLYWIVLLMGLLCGLLGLFYNMVLVRLTLWEDSLHRLPAWLRAAIPFAVSGLLLWQWPDLVGGVGIDTLALASPQLLAGGLTLLLPLLLGKIFYSGISFASGIAGGLLMPMLLTGSLAGACVAAPLLQAGIILPDQVPVLLVLGMGSLFAATVRAPLTGAALVMEMAGCFSAAPAVIPAALLAALLASRLGGMPVYDSLKLRILRRQAAATSTSSAERVMKNAK